MFPVEDKKKEKSSKFLSRLKSKREKPHSQPQMSERHSSLIDIVRAQMQASYKSSPFSGLTFIVFYRFRYGRLRKQ